MAYKNRYFKNLHGRLYSFIGITKQVEYSDSASYTAFVTEAVDGEVGIFNATTGALCPGSTTPTATTDPIFIAVKQGSSIRKSKTFRKADVKATRMAYVAPVKGSVSIVLGAVTPTAGDEVAVNILDLTHASSPIHSMEFRYIVKAGNTIDDVGTALAAKINDTASIELRDRDQLVTATYTAGTNTLVITNKDFGQVTKVLLLDKMAEWGTATVTATVLGSGFPDEVRLFELQGNIAAGVTTQHPDAPATAADFGQPASMVADGVQYNHYTIELVSQDSAKIVDKVQYFPDCLELIVASNGAANAEAEVKYVLDL